MSSMISILILFCSITIFQETRVVGKKSAYEYHSSVKGGLSWLKESFASRECNGERQPVVEIWHFDGLQYLFFSQRVTWEEGRMLCLNYNARLAILDNMGKATNVAKSIADSNIEMQDSWIGGRRIDFSWTWIETVIRSGIKTQIPMEPNVEDFPPWTREPIRPTKECLAIDRRSHDYPNFIDLDCRLQRPIICEKKSDEMLGVPIPSKWIQIGQSTFTLYHGKVTWHEAATFCRAQGTRLAIIKTSTVIGILTNGMTKTRPDFESVWIGAYFSYGQWIWMATGSILNPLTDESGYPPWRFGRPEKNDGCLLLDRHLEDTTNFIETTCDRKRDFICEEYPEDEDEDWQNEPAKFSHGNSTYIIYPLDKTWSESRSFCNERGSVLAHVGSIETLKLIIDAMGDHPREIHHLWLGGEFRSKNDEWYWIDNDEILSKLRNDDGFPPWANVDTGLDHDPASSSCLNLDRSNHVRPHFYGLDCASKQSFVCKITCDVPPSVKNGTWKCYEIAEGRECSLECDAGLFVMGVGNVTCTFIGGWVTGLHWLEFPLCMEPTAYTSRMIRSVSHDIQKSAGYYIVIDHTEPSMRSLSLRLAERLVKAFPVSRNLQMGMTCFSTDPPTRVPFNQTDNCDILEIIHSTKSKVPNAIAETKNDSSFYNDVSLFKGRRILIIVMIDSRRASIYADAIDKFKSAGHHVTVIGLEEDWKILLPMATVGFDRRSNIFLLNDVEQEKIIQELEKLELKPSKCKNFTDTDNDISTEISIPEATTLEGLVPDAPVPEAPVPEAPVPEASVPEAPIPEVAETTPATVPTEEEIAAPPNPEELANRRSGVPPAIYTRGGVTNITEGLPRVYSEQGPKRDVEDNQAPGQTIVAKDSSENNENSQEKDRRRNRRFTTNGQLEHQPDDENESAE